jgi:hypothetical protein
MSVSVATKRRKLGGGRKQVSISSFTKGRHLISYRLLCRVLSKDQNRMTQPQPQNCLPERPLVCIRDFSNVFSETPSSYIS